nr:hypothetical protein [Vogesella sp. LIG4]
MAKARSERAAKSLFVHGSYRPQTVDAFMEKRTLTLGVTLASKNLGNFTSHSGCALGRGFTELGTNIRMRPGPKKSFDDGSVLLPDGNVQRGFAMSPIALTFAPA